MFDKFLKQHKATYEDLSEEEKVVFNNLVTSVEKNQLTLENFKEALESARNTVMRELVDYLVSDKSDKQACIKDANMKARLKNYMLLLEIYQANDKNRKLVESMLLNAA